MSAFISIVFCSAWAKPVDSLSGDISGRTFFADTLYLVKTDIFIAEGANCHIPAGVIFAFSEQTSFTIAGTITVDGQDSAEVIFTSVLDSLVNAGVSGNNSGFNGLIPSSVDWKGLHFKAGAENSFMRYLMIKYAEQPITSDIQRLEGRNVRFQESESDLVKLFNNELVARDDFFFEKREEPETVQSSDSSLFLPPPTPEPVKKPLINWTKKNKIRAGLILSSVAWTSAAVGSFVFADIHAGRRDDQSYIASDPDGKYDILSEEKAEKAGKLEVDVTNRFVGLGIMSGIFGAASLVGLGFTFTMEIK